MLKLMGKKSSKLKLSPTEIQEYKRYVDFLPSEIQYWFEEYSRSLHGNHKELTKEEFTKVYNKVFPGEASNFTSHIFRTFDRDSNGTVNFKEFLIGLWVSGSENTSDSKLQWAFDMYDIKGVGFITKEGIKEILEAVYTMTKIPDLQNTEAIVEEIFTQFDMNCDGKITFEEFRDGALKIPMIIHVLQLDPHPNG